MIKQAYGQISQETLGPLAGDKEFNELVSMKSKMKNVSVPSTCGRISEIEFCERVGRMCRVKMTFSNEKCI